LHQVGDLFELNLKLRCQKVNNYSGDDFEKLLADAPPRVKTQKDPYKMSFTELQRGFKVQLNLLKLSTINGLPGLSSSVLQLYLALL